MKSTKLLKLITFLGTSLFSINEVYAGLQTCSPTAGDRKRETVQYCIDDNVIMENGNSVGEGNFYFSSENKKIDNFSSNTNIAYAYKCTPQGSGVICNEIKEAGLYDAGDEYVNVYYNDSVISYQIITTDKKAHIIRMCLPQH